MGYGKRVCDLGNFRVVDLRQHPKFGVVAYLDMQFEVVGSALELHLEPIAVRTEGIDLFVTNVGADIEENQLQRGEANAKVLFDPSVRGVARAAKCLQLFIEAIEESLSNLDPATHASLTHNYRDDLESAYAGSWIPRGDSLESGR